MSTFHGITVYATNIFKYYSSNEFCNVSSHLLTTFYYQRMQKVECLLMTDKMIAVMVIIILHISITANNECITELLLQPDHVNVIPS